MARDIAIYGLFDSRPALADGPAAGGVLGWLAGPGNRGKAASRGAFAREEWAISIPD